MKIFKITFSKFSKYLLPALGTPLTFLCLLYFNHSYLHRANDGGMVIIATVMMLTTTVPCIALLINHYCYFKETTLQYDELTEEFYFTSPALTRIFKKADIVAITEYYAATDRVPWHNVNLFEIKLSNTVIHLATMIIPRSTFADLFSGKEITVKNKYFVWLNKPAQ